MILSIVSLGVLIASGLQPTEAANEVLRARSYIYEAVKGGVGTKLIGIIDFEQQGTFVKLNGSLAGLAPGLHGFHIHEKGDIGNGCLASAGHFNPHKLTHGAPDDSNRHVGDLGNINSPPSGATPIAISDSLISLTGAHSVLGRAVVVHEKADDLGRGNNEDSKKTGNAGARIACGVIGILDEVEVFPTTPPLKDEPPTTKLSSYSLHLISSILGVCLLVWLL